MVGRQERHPELVESTLLLVEGVDDAGHVVGQVADKALFLSCLTTKVQACSKNGTGREMRLDSPTCTS